MRGDVQPCGTTAAYQRHLKSGEPACEACRAARAAYTRDRRAGMVPARVPPQCGTLSGHDAHRYRGEPSCRPCLDAYAAYVRDRRARLRRGRAERAAALEALLVQVWEETAGR